MTASSTSWKSEPFREGIPLPYQAVFSVIRELWDENADYVGVDGTLTTRGAAIEKLLGHILKANSGKVTQNATIERVRFLAPDMALVDGAWTITGAVDAAGKELPAIKGRGLELVKKTNGHWRFVATREMVIWKGC
jgi:hypothetical protein